MKNIIHYGFGVDYLKDWGINEALREVYQNFLDYGEYTEKLKKLKNGNIQVSLYNNWSPESLDFLRIGNSVKKEGSIGKHGEGIKMAFMIFIRNGLKSRIITQSQVVLPSFYDDKEIGKCFCFEYLNINGKNDFFTIQFEINPEDFKGFRENVISENDIIFSLAGYGDIVDKPKGNIYSGGLFVANLPNIQKSYNIVPEQLNLDRDRSVPRSFDVNWAASRINEAYDKWNFVDTTYDDMQYVSTVPDRLKSEVKPIIVGSSIEFVHKGNDGEDVIIKNENIKQILKRDSFFEKAIKKLKKFVAQKLGLYELLVEFREKHVVSAEARIDFDLILEKVKPNEE